MDKQKRWVIAQKYELDWWTKYCDNIDWYEKIESAIIKSDLRKTIANKGKKYALDRYSKKKIHMQWDKVIRSLGFELP